MASNCCCHDRCILPSEPADRHFCIGCKLPIHAVCGIIDESSDSIAYMNWCFECNENRKVPAQPTPGQFSTTTTSKKKPPPQSQTGVHNSKKTKQNSKPARVTTRPFKIVAPSISKDHLTGRKVAFPLQGPDRPTWLNNQTLQQYGEEFDNIPYLLGNVSHSKNTKSNTPYIVEWEATKCGTTPMDAGTVMFGIETASKLHENKRPILDNQKKRHPLSSRLRDRLYAVDDDEIGHYPSSDDDSDDDNDDESTYDPVVPQKSSLKNHFLDLNDIMDDIAGNDNGDTENLPRDDIDVIQDGLHWKVGGTLQSPINISKNETSRLKNGTSHHFNNPLSSFLSFVPLDFWKLWVYETNRYATQKIATSPMATSFKPITLPEFMTFFGILLAMTLQPMPGRRYTRAWDEPDVHAYTKYMNKSRFIQIRSVLHMVNNDSPNTKMDSLYKVRPLLNVIKKTLGAFIQVGSECSLDESSVACRSAYGRHFIYYNPTKPTGKYHFRFYLLCETDYYNCVRFRMQTRDDCDIGDGFNAMRDVTPDDTTRPQQAMEKLVLDMCSPLFYTGKVVNTDNFYTSPLVFVELFKKGVYARGTCRGNRVAYPKIIQFSSSEANKGKRGDVRMATSQDPPLVAFSWLDGNPVNFLSSADGTEISQVNRRVGRQKTPVKAPSAIARYNKNMQAVDRFDQLNQLFSLAKRHKFHKYYNKLTMALLDIALVNAEQHYFMVDGRTRRDESRYQFRKDLSVLFLETAWDNFQLDSDIPFTNLFATPRDASIVANPPMAGTNRRLSISPTRFDGFLMAPTVDEPRPLEGIDESPFPPITCHPVSVIAYMKKNNAKPSGGRSYHGSRCQVCAWERRTDITKHVAFCSEHGIRMCTVHRPLPSDSPFSIALNDETKSTALSEWYCPDQSATCWQKGHHFYIPRGVWGKSPTIKYDKYMCPKTKTLAIGSHLYKKRLDWLLAEGLLREIPKTRGRKRKSQGDNISGEKPTTTTDTANEFNDTVTDERNVSDVPNREEIFLDCLDEETNESELQVEMFETV